MDPAVTARLRVCVELMPKPCGIVVFGASGDLAGRKLLPSLFNLWVRKLIPRSFFVLGCARTAMTTAEFRERVRAAIARRCEARPDECEAFARRCAYLAGDYFDAALYATLAQRLAASAAEFGAEGGAVFYLAVPPPLYGPVVGRLSAAGLLRQGEGGEPWRRVVIEKPFGRDLASAAALGREIRRVLGEDQIYRIDHYLGKETVQNILMLRFANAVFEPLWNRRYVDHVQITAAESIGLEHRAGYFEEAGLLRDMFQNHLFMMLALTALEPPVSFAADSVRDEIVKVLRAVRPFTAEDLRGALVRGQYAAGEVGGKAVPAYRAEKGVAPESRTETYVAAKLGIDNWRWKGVPFYLRAGKRLPRRVSEIAIAFKSVPHSIFIPLLPEHLSPNVLVLNVQPDEGVALTIQAKQPGAKLCVGDLTMRFNYREVFGGEPPDAYERLLLDCMLGDQTLFLRQDAIEVSWSLLDPVLDAWSRGGEEERAGALHSYRAGTWGPEEAEALLGRDGRQWREP